MARDQKTLEGTLTDWNDERGFGFISAPEADTRLFVHISAFPRGSHRPVVGEAVRFTQELSADGKQRATHAWRVADNKSNARRGHGSNPRTRAGSYIVIFAFFVLGVTIYVYWNLPLPVISLYLAASTISFLAYAADKAAARSGAWRTSESALHILGLIGGWPGAIVAQQTLRHKTQKRSFRVAFWASVIVNILAFVLVCSPSFPVLLDHFLSIG